MAPREVLRCSELEGGQLKKYRRIEVHAYRRRVTVVSGSWRPDELFKPSPAHTEEVSLNDSDDDQPVEPDSPEGQLILVEAIRTLEQRLSPEARALIQANENTEVLESRRIGLFFKLQSFCQFIWSKALRFAR